MTTARENFAKALEACFSDIAVTRMAGVPILNPKLAVEAVAPRDFGNGHLTILVTPWFMNVIMQAPNDGEDIGVGTKRIFALPAGRFEFIRGREDRVGGYWMCSLFSPMFEFEDQAAAVATAANVMDELFGAELEDREDERDMAAMWQGEWPDQTDPPERQGAGTTGGGNAHNAGNEEDCNGATAPADACSRRDLFNRFRPANQRQELAG